MSAISLKVYIQTNFLAKIYILLYVLLVFILHRGVKFFKIKFCELNSVYSVNLKGKIRLPLCNNIFFWWCVCVGGGSPQPPPPIQNSKLSSKGGTPPPPFHGSRWRHCPPCLPPVNALALKSINKNL